MARATLAAIEAAHADAIAQLQDALAEERRRAAIAEGRLRSSADELRAAKAEACQTRALFDDLKQRLAASEAEVQRMGGYIERIQEDDVVREDLVQTSTPGGEQRLVPKRKPAPFHHLRSSGPLGYYGGPAGGGMATAGYVADAAFYKSAGVDRPKPQHPLDWVTY